MVKLKIHMHYREYSKFCDLGINSKTKTIIVSLKN